MTLTQFITLLASGTATQLRESAAQSILEIAREPADGRLRTLTLKVPEAYTIDLPIRLVETATPLPDRVRSVELGPAIFIDSVMLIVNREIGIGLVARRDAVAINVARPA